MWKKCWSWLEKRPFGNKVIRLRARSIIWIFIKACLVSLKYTWDASRNKTMWKMLQNLISCLYRFFFFTFLFSLMCFRSHSGKDYRVYHTCILMCCVCEVHDRCWKNVTGTEAYRRRRDLKTIHFIKLIYFF